MDDYVKHGERARRHIYIADHMLTQTYPLVKDPKLLLGVLDNILSSLAHTLSMVLAHERTYKRIPPFQNTFESKMNMFKWKLVNLYHINTEYITLIEEVSDIIKKHKECPVEFARKNHFVICTDTYRMRTLSVEQMKKYISKARLFLTEMTNIVNRK